MTIVTASDEDVAALNEAYDFYQKVNEENELLDGQYIAVPSDQTAQRKGDVYVFQAIAPIMPHANTQVDYCTVDSAYLSRCTKVGGKNAAAKVANQHSKLIGFLLQAVQSPLVQ